MLESVLGSAYGSWRFAYIYWVGTYRKKTFIREFISLASLPNARKPLYRSYVFGSVLIFKMACTWGLLKLTTMRGIAMLGAILERDRKFDRFGASRAQWLNRSSCIGCEEGVSWDT